ncbi:MAG: branched-chain amino acid ABC transporter permease [Aestuariivita sp.]|nr:branched-chain amino acid ABC transporter permease [Aestuariivita sp.]MCY4202861.1 branched-chain amino acid ABC transporter permease [Aestuariivita sp.]MCY4288737.1 branched-chain amino acid ABC transporter permease [Aestuariivita sp.]MCY4346678.1 branched-chain amino acid ABC transporter permease [Aestuariivita sp.]
MKQVHPNWWLAAALLVLYPFPANDFFTVQIGAYSLILGTIALSLMILAGYGGMVSLSQLTAAGLAAYMVPILGTNTQGVLGFGWSYWFTLPVAVLTAALFSALVGLIAVRNSGIYMIMITLAVAVSVFFFTRQNYEIFNGFTGYSGIEAPKPFGLDLRAPIPFYYLCLIVAVTFVLTTLYTARTPFGLSLQAVRDNPRRASALGYSVPAVRISAFFLAGIIAGVGGIMLVFLNGRISPGTIGVDVVIDILVIAVVGGLRHPIGPFLGALAFVLLENFAIDLIDRERFNTVIGGAFLLIVLFSPDGLLGLWGRLKPQIGLASMTTKRGSQSSGLDIEPNSLKGRLSNENV